MRAVAVVALVVAGAGPVAAQDPPVPPALVVARNRLLEDCLRALKQVRVAAEKERTEQVRKALLVEIEKERAEAKRRAADQSKRLQLDVEETEPDAAD